MLIDKMIIRPRSQGTSSNGASLFFIVAISIACLVSGALIGMELGIVVGLLIAVFGAVLLLAYPVPLIWVVFLGAVVVSGPVEMYFPAARQLRWGISMLGFALIASAVLHHLFNFKKPAATRRPTDATLQWLGVFVVAAVAGLFYSRHVSTGLIGLKTYTQACGVLLALAWLSIPRARVDRLMKALVVIGLIQLPFALQQYFINGSNRIAASSSGIVADGVVGTFSGTELGGGAGPVLSALQIMVICILIYWWRHGRLSLTRLVIMASICIFPVFLNATNISLVAIPIALSLVFVDKLKKNPLQFIAGSIATVLLLAGMFMFYVNSPAGSAYGHADASSTIQDTVAYNVGDKGYGVFELNRTTVYTFWAKQHGLSNPVETLIGHGLGSSGEGGSIKDLNLATLEYRGKGIGLTAISSLLWDVGALGTFALVAMFWTAFRLSGQLLSRSKGNDVIGDGLLMGARVGITILGLNLVHNNYFCFEFGYQTLVMLTFGYVAYRARNQMEDSPPATLVAPARKRFR